LSRSLLLALALTASAQTVGPGGPGGPIEQQTPWRLLTSAAVRADLKVSADQKAKLDAIPDAVRAKNKAQGDDLRAKSDANAAARKKMLAELDKAVNEAVAAGLTPAQVTRLKQLHVQALGLDAFNLPAVRAALKPTEAQLAALRKLTQEWPEAFQKAQEEAQRQAGGDPEKLRRLFEARYEEVSRDYLGRGLLLLNADQRKAWEALAGPPGRLSADGPPREPVLAALRVALADEPIPGGGDHTDLLDHPGLAKALGLGKDEAERLAAAVARVAQRFQGPAQKLQDEAGQLEVDRLTFDVHLAEEARGRAMKDVLKPEQAKRLTEIELQARGLWAFGEPEVMKALKLTPEQAEAVEVAGDRVSHQAQGAAAPGVAPADPKQWEAEAAKRVGPPMRDGLAAVLGKLSDEQKKAWRELAGEPFDFSKVTEASPYVEAVLSGPASPAIRCTLRGGGLAQQRKYAEARAQFEEGARLGPKNPETLNGLAYFLATCADDKQRDGRRALALAKQVDELSGGKDPNYLDTLAAAHAEVGAYDEAIKAQTKALELAPAYMRPQLEERLKMLRDKKPIRQ
jgi:tetratricopeptide (TPR) repeat protein